VGAAFGRGFARGCLIAWLAIPAARADIVTDWNQLLIDALRAENAGPTGGTRTGAIVHAAIYDAVNSILRTHEPFRFSLPASDQANVEAAALAAAYETLSLLCPSKKGAFDAAYQGTLAQLPPGTATEEGLQIGRSIGLMMLEWRSADGSTTALPYIPSDAPGAWRRTPPGFRPPLDSHWGNVLPFGLTSVSHFPVPPPPPLDSPQYTQAFEQVRLLGAKESAARTADQTEIGIFWAYDRDTMGPPNILYNQMARVIAGQMGNSLAENARLFALLNIAQADAAIVCWRAKYQYNLWRPITGIRAADIDDNPATNMDAEWEPMGAPGGPSRPDFTPPFPSYPSGHGTLGAAAFRILARYYGGGDLQFTCPSDEIPGVTRLFASLRQADEENALSRVYLGVHWIFDQTEGQHSGWAIADYLFHNILCPVSSTPKLGPPIRLPDESLAVHLSAPAGTQWTIEMSEDLERWAPAFTGEGPFSVVDPMNARPSIFYRAIRME
jgi:hypothetical protein